ncbi:hypothetical protein F4778DRAFT_717529, partial [Xylariomycetidae sp. FL2044]
MRSSLEFCLALYLTFNLLGHIHAKTTNWIYTRAMQPMCRSRHTILHLLLLSRSARHIGGHIFSGWACRSNGPKAFEWLAEKRVASRWVSPQTTAYTEKKKMCRDRLIHFELEETYEAIRRHQESLESFI